MIDQFLKDECNQRTDGYGGPIENRVKFALEVVDACCDQIGSKRVGLRLGPFGGFLNATDTHAYALNTYLMEELNKRDLAYVHMIEPTLGQIADVATGKKTLAPFRHIYKGTFIAAGGYNKDRAEQALATDHADLIGFGNRQVHLTLYTSSRTLGPPKPAPYCARRCWLHRLPHHGGGEGTGEGVSPGTEMHRLGSRSQQAA